MTWQIHLGDNRDILRTLPDNSIDSIVTDPPYGIDFLGKDWDANTGALETYQECLRVLKPGGHILAFSAARTYHHLAVTLEQAGFEIRDQIMWIYSSGFPKSQDVGRSIERAAGKKTSKPKLIPYENKQPGSQGLGATRGRCPKCLKDQTHQLKCVDAECVLTVKPADNEWSGWGTALKPAHEPICLARKPLKMSIAKNVQQWGVGALNIDATRIPTDEVIVCGAGNANTFNKFNAENNVDGPGTGVKINKDVEKWQQAEGGRFPSNVIGEIPDYQKYFYCPKVSRSERHINDATNNNHPTVKPIELMKYLIRLVTPAGGTVLDPFNGSGSTGCAAVELGHPYIGCELDPAYVKIAETRIQAWLEATQDPLQATGLFE